MNTNLDFEVKVLADSITAKSNRLTTFQVKYPFIIHAEVMTHRQLSRNFSSARSVPASKIVQNGQFYYPKDVRKNQKGMQGYENVNDNILLNFHEVLSYLSNQIQNELKPFEKEIHKQHINRYIMPFNYMYGIISATEWDNFLNLRIQPDVMPELQVLAKMIKQEKEKSLPKVLKLGEWHIPYLLEDEKENIAISLYDKLLISSARCARISYMNHGINNIDLEKDIQLGKMLLENKHMSPFEHCATPGHSFYYSNFKGFVSFRKFIEVDLQNELTNTKIYNMYINGLE